MIIKMHVTVDTNDGIWEIIDCSSGFDVCLDGVVYETFDDYDDAWDYLTRAVGIK